MNSTPRAPKRRGRARASTVVTPGVVATTPVTAPATIAAQTPQSKAKAGVDAAKKMMEKCIVDTT